MQENQTGWKSFTHKEVKKVQSYLVGKLKEKKPLEIPRCRWHGRITVILSGIRYIYGY
jgi:hypothetical protein